MKAKTEKYAGARQAELMRQEAEQDRLQGDLESLVRRVAALDDAGLDVHCKSAIREARRIRRVLERM